MIPLLVVSNALAESPAAASPPVAMAVVALGDGVVSGADAAASEGPPAVPGGWVTVLADCLQERAAQRFSVVDRATPGTTVRGARERLGGVRELTPAWVILTLGAPELGAEPADTKKLGKELESLVGELRKPAGGGPSPNILLVGVVPPTLAQAQAQAQAEAPVPAPPPPPGSPPDAASEADASPGQRPRPTTPTAPDQAELDQRTAGWNRILASIANPGQGIVHLDLWSDWPKEGDARAALTVHGWSLSDQGHAKLAASVCDAVLARP